MERQAVFEARYHAATNPKRTAMNVELYRKVSAAVEHGNEKYLRRMAGEALGEIRRLDSEIKEWQSTAVFGLCVGLAIGAIVAATVAWMI